MPKMIIRSLTRVEPNHDLLYISLSRKITWDQKITFHAYQICYANMLLNRNSMRKFYWQGTLLNRATTCDHLRLSTTTRDQRNFVITTHYHPRPAIFSPPPPTTSNNLTASTHDHSKVAIISLLPPTNTHDQPWLNGQYSVTTLV